MATGSPKRARLIAYYLPQFHPIPENDRWWGKGFTEWTNVAKARPLFHGHYQPHLPSDLGYYDLCVPDARNAQAELARRYGIEAFCYWHYWFAGKELLERPFHEVLDSGEPDFPFCLAWSNQSWAGHWHGLGEDRVLIAQTYPGPNDHRAHFYALLRAFTDKRYVTVDGKPLFLVQRPTEMHEPQRFTDLWRELALREGLKGIYFVGLAEPTWRPQSSGFDAGAIDNPGALIWLMGRDRYHRLATRARRIITRLAYRFPGAPTTYLYDDVLRYALPPLADDYDQYPGVIPNWDNTPRTGCKGFVFYNSTPEKFALHLRKAIVQVAGKEPDKRLVFVKSWNEWAEGNYLEPDQRFGRAYLEATAAEVFLDPSHREQEAPVLSTTTSEPPSSVQINPAPAQGVRAQAAPALPAQDQRPALQPATSALVTPRAQRRVVVFYSQKPYPPQSGFHWRGLSLLSGLRDLGCDTTLLGQYDENYSPWDAGSIALLAQREHLAKNFGIYHLTEDDQRLRLMLHKWYELGKRDMPIDCAYYTPPGMQRWLSQSIEDASPDVIIMFYAMYDRLLDHQRFSSTIRAIDTIDIVTQTRRMWHALEQRLPRLPIDPDRVDERVLDERFFDHFRSRMDPAEARMYDKYSHAIAISPRDAEIIRQNTRETNVVWIPMTREPQYLANSHAGSALFTTGPNPFNLQGLLYFIRRVLPLVRLKAPEFSLDVTGACCDQVSASDGIVMRGFVPDLKDVYRDACFAVCPIFGGTGQLIKIVEALAHGVPVVAFRYAATGSPILRHGENGFVADSAAEFADYVVELWQNRDLCRIMGEAARASVAAECAGNNMLQSLERIVMSPSPQSVERGQDA